MDGLTAVVLVVVPKSEVTNPIYYGIGIRGIIGDVYLFHQSVEDSEL
jgi:hypothetical protein